MKKKYYTDEPVNRKKPKSRTGIKTIAVIGAAAVVLGFALSLAKPAGTLEAAAAFAYGEYFWG